MQACELVDSLTQIVSLPDIYYRTNRLIDEPSCTSEKLAGIISHDPGLTARILKLANSSYYSRPQRVETVAQAITLVGISELRHLVLATSAAQAFRDIPNTLVSMEVFWRHSVCCALAARALAERCRIRQCERIFVIGLLHDIGQLLIYHQLPEAAGNILNQLRAGAADRCAREQRELGFTHAEVSAELLKAWKMPASLWEPVRYHHDPLAAQQFEIDAALVYIGNTLAEALEPDSNLSARASAAAQAVDPRVWAVCGQSEAVLEEIAFEVNLQWFEVLEVIKPGSSAIY
jgi:HD-like signal output (HDOD) protein